MGLAHLSEKKPKVCPLPPQQNELMSPAYMDSDNLIQWPGVRF